MLGILRSIGASTSWPASTESDERSRRMEERMPDAEHYREMAERCFRAVEEDPGSVAAAQFELWGREFLALAERLEAEEDGTSPR